MWSVTPKLSDCSASTCAQTSGCRGLGYCPLGIADKCLLPCQCSLVHMTHGIHHQLLQPPWQVGSRMSLHPLDKAMVNMGGRGIQSPQSQQCTCTGHGSREHPDSRRAHTSSASPHQAGMSEHRLLSLRSCQHWSPGHHRRRAVSMCRECCHLHPLHLQFVASIGIKYFWCIVLKYVKNTFGTLINYQIYLHNHQL